jgi:hypothetical protein
MQAGTVDVAFFTSRAGAAACRPCLIVAVKKHGSLKVHDYVVEIVYIFVAFLDMAVQEYTVFV